MKLRTTGKLLLLSGTALAFTTTAAFAQEASDSNVSEGARNEIIVTATKRAEKLQDIPLSVSALSGRDLESRGLSDISQVARFMPSLRFATANTPRNAGIFMRGIGQVGNNQGIEPSVGVFLDGVYLPIPGPLQSNLRDISTVEVLRGPQGTLYGRNTPVGAININTRAPTQTAEASITASYGNYNDKQISGYLGGGLGENLAGRVSFWYGDRDGYETNLATGKDINSASQYGVRGRLKWDPVTSLSVNLIGYYTRMKVHCCSPEQLDIPTLTTPGFLAGSAALGTPYKNFVTGDHKVEEYNTGLDIMSIAGGSLNVEADLGNVGTLTSITAYSWIEDDARDPAFAGLARPTLSKQGQFLTRKGWTEELRLASPKGQTLEYLAGLYLLDEDVNFQTFFTMGPGADRVFPPAGLKLAVGDNFRTSFVQKTTSLAGFGQLKLNLSDKLHLIGGLRYTHDKKTAESHSIPDPTSSALFRTALFRASDFVGLRHTENRPTYSLTAQYDLAPHVMAYVTYGTGSKSGGYNGGSVAPGVPIEFKVEKSDTLEVGLKSSFLDNRVIVNFDLYRMNNKDFQDTTQNPMGSGFVVGNAGDRRSQGFELEMQVQPTDNLTLRGALTYLDAKFTRYTAGQCYVGQVPNGSSPGTCDYTGKRPYRAPPVTASFVADYRHALGATGDKIGFISGDLSYTGEEYTFALLDPRSKQHGFALLGGRLGVEDADGRWRVSLYGKNLTNHVYYQSTAVLVLNAVMSAGGTSAPNGFVGYYGAPRTYGIEGSIKF